MTTEICICFIDGNRRGKKISFSNKDNITFGRSTDSGIIFSSEANPTISRQHARLEKSGENWYLIDNSTNGTYINGQKIHHSKAIIKGQEHISFSHNGEVVSVEFGNINGAVSSDSEYGKELASFTKIIPIAKKGFFSELSSQPFFIPGLITVISGVLLFSLLEMVDTTGEIFFIYLYEFLLGSYIGIMLIYFVMGISSIKVPIWFPIATALFTALVLIMELPLLLLSLIFRPPIIENMMSSYYFIPSFIGHFIGAGLLEELLKSIPVWLAIILRPRFSRLHISGFLNNRMTPTIGVLIGASSAVGFIIVETLLKYVPNVQDQFGLGMGLMLLIPRFITGIAGHAAWTGIFAYFIGLGFYYKKGKFLYPLMGWIISSGLHGLWNAGTNLNIIFGVGIALITFIGFTTYLFKASKIYST